MDIPVLRNDSCVSERKAAAAGDVRSALGCSGVAWTEAEAFPKPDTSDGSRKQLALLGQPRWLPALSQSLLLNGAKTLKSIIQLLDALGEKVLTKSCVSNQGHGSCLVDDGCWWEQGEERAGR